MIAAAFSVFQFESPTRVIGRKDESTTVASERGRPEPTESTWRRPWTRRNRENERRSEERVTSIIDVFVVAAFPVDYAQRIASVATAAGAKGPELDPRQRLRKCQGSALGLLRLAPAKAGIAPVQRPEWNLVRGLFVVNYSIRGRNLTLTARIKCAERRQTSFILLNATASYRLV